MAFWVEEEGRAREDEPPAWRERDIIVVKRMSRKDGMVEILICLFSLQCFRTG